MQKLTEYFVLYMYSTAMFCMMEYEILNNGIYMARKQVTYQFNHL